jgi:hypothetical protein
MATTWRRFRIPRQLIRSRMPEVFAIFGLIAIISLMIAVQKNCIPLLDKTGRITNMKRRVVITGVTVAASAFTTSVTHRIRRLLLRSMEDDIRRYMLRQTGTTLEQSDNDIYDLNCKWRGILAIDNFVIEKVKNFQYNILWIMWVLNTTAIVIASIPSDTTPVTCTLPLRPPRSGFLCVGEKEKMASSTRYM